MTDDQTEETPGQTPEETPDPMEGQVSDYLDRRPAAARDFTDINILNLENWVEALRSGSYPQGRCSLVRFREEITYSVSDAVNHLTLPELHRSNLVEFCCIGVGALRFDAELNRTDNSRCWVAPKPADVGNDPEDTSSSSSTYVGEVMAKTGLTDPDMVHLTTLNDGTQLDFDGIADVLEFVGKYRVSVEAAADLLGYGGDDRGEGIGF